MYVQGAALGGMTNSSSSSFRQEGGDAGYRGGAHAGFGVMVTNKIAGILVASVVLAVPFMVIFKEPSTLAASVA
jgi:hypothetical protein